MARRTATITIDTPGRDHGRVYRLTEMSASAAEEWAASALPALSRSGAEIPEDIARSGLAGLASLGLNGLRGLRWEDAKPLMDAMFECVSILPDARNPQVVRALIEDDVEEVRTRVQLRAEILKLHLDFSPAAGPSTSAAPAASMTAASPIARTSHARSAQ